jgi:tetratricopeptide (TPR) repeat protein
MNQDIQPLLNDWPYEPGQLCVRKIVGHDGREKIQLRIEMGILQMEMSGRPDGQRPFEQESLFHYYQAQAKETEIETNDETFQLDSEACMSLQIEALQYYHRSISFLEIGEYDKARQDAERNLDLFDFVKTYAEDEEDRLAFENYRPFVISHRVRAEVLLYLETDAYDRALEKIDVGIQEIQTFFQDFDRIDLVHENEEVTFLKEWAEEIRNERPKTASQDLKEQLRDAVAHEDFERAAQLRDRLTDLENQPKVS